MSANLQPQPVLPEIVALAPIDSPYSSYTPEKGARFLQCLIDSGGNITEASKAIGITRKTAYNWRDSIQEFAEAWADAIEAGTENLEEVAYKRATETSDTLAIFLLKARRPEKYRENIRVESEVSVNPDSANAFADSLIDRILQRKQEAARELGAGDGPTP